MKKMSFFAAFLFLAFSCSEKAGNPPAVGAGNNKGLFLVSSDFRDNGSISKEFTCDGQNISPSLSWFNAPENTRSFILTVIDPDAPMGNFRHWTVVNIPKNVTFIAKNSVFPAPARALQNDLGKKEWGGPCPPSGTHRYVFTVYAIDIESYDGDVLPLGEFLGKHAIKSAILTGLYKRSVF